MWPLVRSSPEQQAASKFVSAKWKRPLFESDEDGDDEDLKSSTTKLERKRCQLDGNEEAAVSETKKCAAAVSETKKCATAADVGWSQPLSQPDSLNDGSAVPKSASKKFVPLSAAVSAHVEKVVLEDSKETMTVSKCLTGTVKVVMKVSMKAEMTAIITVKKEKSLLQLPVYQIFVHVYSCHKQYFNSVRLFSMGRHQWQTANTWKAH